MAMLAAIQWSCGSGATYRAPNAKRLHQPSVRVGSAISLGSVLDLELEAGFPWRGSLAADAVSYCVLVAEQRALDVRLSVIDASGSEIAATDGFAGTGVDERLALRLPRGSFQVVVEPAEPGAPRGWVRLRVVTSRPWRVNDRLRVQLEAIGREASRLDGSNSQADWQEARELTRSEIAGWRRLGDTQSLIRALNRLTSLERALGDLEPSVRHGREAVAHSVKLGDSRAEAESRYWLAQSLYRAGGVAEASDQFASALDAAERASDRSLQGKVLNWQGRMSRQAGRLSEAHELFSRAVEHLRASHDIKSLGSALNNLALIAKAGGMLGEALGYYEESVQVARLTGIPGADLQRLSNLADLFFARGQWQEALAVWRAGLATAVAIDDHRHEASLATALARALVKLGEPEQARPLLERALEIERRRRDPFSQILILVSLGWLETAGDSLEEAERYFEEARTICLQRGIQTEEAMIVSGLATIQLRQGRPREALRLLQELESDPGLEWRPAQRARALILSSESHLQAGDPARAASSLGEAVDALGDLSVPEIRFQVAFQGARVRLAQDDPQSALAAAELALEIVESLRSTVADPDLRATYLSRVREAYDFTVELLLDMADRAPGQGHAERAFATVERARARSLVELLETARQGAETAVDPELLESERNSLAAVAFARQRFDAAVAAGSENTGELELLNRSLAAAEAQLQAEERRIREAAPRYAQIRFPTPITVAEVQAHLGPDEAFVEYWLRPGAAAAFVLTRDRFSSVRLPVHEDLEALVESMRLSAARPSRRSFGRLLDASRSLGAFLFDPILPAVESRERLIVVADGVLNYLPFEALQIGSATSAPSPRYLIRRHAVTYSPSAGVWLSLERDPSHFQAGGVLVAFADPKNPTPPAGASGPSPTWQRLPGARLEVQAAASAVGIESRVFVGDDALESELKSNADVPRARWLHLAAHALISEEDPASSSVILAPGPAGGEDGYLTVSEVFELALQADLVVLSGCETALGRRVSGEGLIGLTRAFLYAGARGVQVSLWKVADETTAALMANFYRELATTTPRGPIRFIGRLSS